MIPRATYRLQFHKDFGFDDAARIVPYLARLGVSHVYASPWLKARPNSPHGYDIVDHQAINPELGDQAAFERMAAALKANGLGQILDLVPNHMGVGGADNPLWLDVLEWGPDSKYAGWFDIDWQPGHDYIRGKLLVPFLADQYGTELYNGKLILKFDHNEGSFAVWAYHSHKLPISPLHYSRILADSHPRLERMADEFANLDEWWPQVARRAGDLKLELARVVYEDSSAADALAQAVTRINGTPGDESSWDKLDQLIQDQHWRVAYFRVGADDINYRRFFNVNELAGIRMELPEVFEHSHALVFQLLQSGILEGLRIDHVDGLLDPKQYFERLRRAAGDSFYLAVEKILARHEGLRESWPVAGTTGYDFANLALGLLIDPAGEPEITRTYLEFTGQTARFGDVVRDCKLRIMRDEMVSELNVLARSASRLARQNPKTSDFTQNVLRRALREVIACFPVYRTYLDADGLFTEEDRRDLDWAVSRARTNETEIDPSVFDFVYGLLSGDLVAQPHSGFSRSAALRLAMKVQQYSGPVMAKGLEDTAFYRYNRFVALNEVGGDPEQFGVSISQFHKANAQRAKRWPNAMLTTSTHDTKRGEDVRARLAVLSEIPIDWAQQVQIWSRILRARRGDIEGTAPPDRNDEYLLYQLLVGTWPAKLSDLPFDREQLQRYVARLKAAMIKSIREGKIHSSWSLPNFRYEEAVSAFVEGALLPDESQAFFGAFLPFERKIIRWGTRNSLIQTVLKLTSPGIPDIYQGTELWDLSLVDPDNRRPVDFERRIRLLEAGCASYDDGSIKLGVIAKILAYRAGHPDLFALGDYEPLLAEGPRADRVCAFVRRLGDQSAITIVSRFPASTEADPDWAGTAILLPPGLADRCAQDILNGVEISISDGRIPAETLFRATTLPCAVLDLQGDS